MRYLISVIAAAALVLVGSVLPWATLSGTGRILPDYLAGDRRHLEVTINAWSSHVRYGDFAVPNAFVVVAAVGTAIACWARRSGRGDAASVVAIGLALCGLVHTLCFLAILIRSQSGAAGPGSLLAAAALLILLLSALFQGRALREKPRH